MVSTGGRLLLDAVNAEALQRTGRVFCLARDGRHDPRPGRARGGRAAGRPLLAGADARERITALLAERAAGYGAFEQVVTDGRTPAEIVDDHRARLAADRPSPRSAPDGSAPPMETWLLVGRTMTV